jgi:hypothetical protein
LTAAIQSKPEDVDAWTRAFAEEQARRAGLTVREWLDRFVVEQADRAESASLAAEADDDLTLAVEPSPEVERVLERQLAQLDVADAPAPAEASDDPAMRLGDIESALQQIREDIHAAEPGPAIAGEPLAPTGTETPPGELPRSSIGAIEGLSLEFARLAEMVHCGLERFETITAREVAELRGEVAQLFDGLAARVDTVERRSIGPLDADLGDALDEPGAMLDEPAHLTAAAAPEPDPAAADLLGGADADHTESFSLDAVSADTPNGVTELEPVDETWDSLFEPSVGDVAEHAQAPRNKGAFFPWRFGQTKRLLRSA